MASEGDQTNIREQISDLLPCIRENYKVNRLWVFGSYARQQADGESDIDILVEFLQDADMFDGAGLRAFLEDQLNISVDLVSTNALREELKNYIEPEAVQV